MAVPDLGVDKATVAEILVQVGDTVEADQSLIVVESDKATVEVPSTTAGVIQAIHVELGQSVAQGNALVTIVTASAAAPAAACSSSSSLCTKYIASSQCCIYSTNHDSCSKCAYECRQTEQGAT